MSFASIIRICACVFVVQTAIAETLTWDQCVQEVMDNNPQLMVALRAFQKAQSDLRASYASYYPQVSAESSFRQSDSDANGSSQSQSIALNANQSIFSGFHDRVEVEKAKIAVELSRTDLADAQAQVSFDLKQAFTHLLFAQDQLNLAKTIEQRQNQNVELVELRYETGKEHEGSLMRRKALLKEAQFDVAQAEREIYVAQRELATALGRSISKGLIAQGKLEIQKIETVDTKDLVSQTPAYRVAELQLKLAEADVKTTKSGFYPTVSASATASREDENWPPEQDQWVLGLSISLPLFEGRRNVNNLIGSKLEVERLEADLQNVHDQTLFNLDDAYAALEDAAERRDVESAFLDSANIRAEIARSQYSSGLISFQDWDIIESDLINSQKTMLSSLRNAVSAEATWEHVQGKSAFQ